MSVYVLPSLIGLMFKLFILAYAAKDKKFSASLLFLIMVFACHNLIEFVGYIQFLDEQTVSVLFRTYYVATVIMLASLPIHAIFITQSMNHHRGMALVVGSVAAALVTAILFTDLIIAGNFSIGYSLTAVEGPHFLLFALFLAATLISSVAILTRGYLKAQEQLDSTRSVYSLAAIMPVVLVLGIGIVFKIVGVNVNFAGALPIATTFFVFLILKTESKHQLMDVRRFIPFSRERQASLEILRLMDKYSQSSSEIDSYQELRNGIEREAIRYTLEKCDHNITRAAKMMGLQNRSTLYSMLKRLEINVKDGRVSN